MGIGVGVMEVAFASDDYDDVTDNDDLKKYAKQIKLRAAVQYDVMDYWRVSASYVIESNNFAGQSSFMNSLVEATAYVQF